MPKFPLHFTTIVVLAWARSFTDERHLALMKVSALSFWRNYGCNADKRVLVHEYRCKWLATWPNDEWRPANVHMQLSNNRGPESFLSGHHVPESKSDFGSGNLANFLGIDLFSAYILFSFEMPIFGLTVRADTLIRICLQTLLINLQFISCIFNNVFQK